MVRSNLKLESLESREVPAVVLEGTFDSATNTVTANGGTVNIQEVQLDSITGTDIVLTSASPFNFVNVQKLANATDSLTLSASGGTLTVGNGDGVYVRVTNIPGAVGTPFFFDFGNTLEVQNVTGLNVNLQLGGNDSITDMTDLTATLNGGLGNDTIKTMGSGAINPFLLQGLGGGGGGGAINPLLFGMMGGQKTLQGGAGDDNLTGPIFGFFTQLDGGDGNDTIIGGLGLDIITGGNGFDILFGFGGGDFYIAFDFGPDFIINQAGDQVFGDMFDIIQTPV